MLSSEAKNKQISDCFSSEGSNVCIFYTQQGI